MIKSNTLDIMLDVETLGNGLKPVITQLSAVSFQIESGKPLSEFNRFIKPQSCAKVGLSCESPYGSVPTMDFWLKQEESVFNKVILKAFTEGEELREVLFAFTDWLKEEMKKNNCSKVKVWGNGPVADCVWVRSAYNACSIEAPWKYWDDADVRTYDDIGMRAFNFNSKKEIEFKGEKHNAIDDCKNQIKRVCAVFEKIKNEK